MASACHLKTVKAKAQLENCTVPYIFRSAFNQKSNIVFVMIISKSMCKLEVCSAHVYMYRFLVYVVYILSASADISSVGFSVGIGQASSRH